MIRFLQTPGPIKKIVLGGLLTVICAAMAITLIPGGIGDSIGLGGPGQGVVAKVAGEPVTSLEVQRDGTSVDRVLWGSPVPVDPGRHEVAALGGDAGGLHAGWAAADDRDPHGPPGAGHLVVGRLAARRVEAERLAARNGRLSTARLTVAVAGVNELQVTAAVRSCLVLSE